MGRLNIFITVKFQCLESKQAGSLPATDTPTIAGIFLTKTCKHKSDQERLEQIQQFYQVYEQQLAFLLEDTQVENPVTNTIFLIHQMDLLVNDHFGLRKEVAIA